MSGQSAAAGTFRSHGVSALAAALLVFAGHLAMGANSEASALAFAAAWFGFLAYLLTRRWAAKPIMNAWWVAPAVPFFIVISVGILSLTPLAPGGASPVWSWVGATRPAASIDPYATRVELVKLAAIGAAFLVGAAFGADDARAERLLELLLAVGFAFAAWALLDHVTNPTSLFGEPRPSDPRRLSAAFGSANTAATLFGSLGLLATASLMRAVRAVASGALYVAKVEQLVLRAAFPLVQLVLFLACLIMTQSRAGLTAMGGASVLLMLLLSVPSLHATATRKWVAAVGSAAAMIVIILTLVGVSLGISSAPLQTRFAMLGQDTVVRDTIFSAHWAAFRAAPWFGYGLGTFPRINELILNPSNLAVLASLGATHNVYLQWLEEAGVVGSVAMFATVGAVTLLLVRGFLARRRMRPWIAALLAALALFLFHGVADYALQVPSMATFLSLLLGVGAGISSGVRVRGRGGLPTPAEASSGQNAAAGSKMDASEVIAAIEPKAAEVRG